ncbi:MAG: flavodoxin-dependent (E)-4-hydroxy-3-methylbut-2-enyl-diphosphate synthase [Leptospirales bacterium]
MKPQDNDLYPKNRRQTRGVNVANVPIGSDSPISVQSMTKTKTEDWQKTVDQIQEYEEAGCQIVRSTVNTPEAAKALINIQKAIHIPLVADIHFDYRLALQALDAGVDKIRINPGNIGSPDKIAEVVNGCKNFKVPIRIGVNSGSLEKDILKKYNYPCSAAMVESAMRHIKILEELEFYNIIVSLKSSNVWMMIEAYRELATRVDYPLHLGVTEAGPLFQGTIRSSVGMGALLAEGIGDTIRVSLTGNGVDEVKAGKEILRSLGLASFGVTIISCPTCGRLEADLISAVQKLEAKTSKLKKNLTLAVMGCVVNGPGEARGADIGVSLGKDYAILYIEGKSQGQIPVNSVYTKVVELIEAWPE